MEVSVPLVQSLIRSRSLVSHALDARVSSLPTVRLPIAGDARREEIQLNKPQRVISVELPLTYVQRKSRSKIFWKHGSGRDGDAEKESRRSNM